MIRRVLLAVLLACLAAALLSCSGSTTEPQEPSYEISVQGVVTDAATGEPIVGFDVVLSSMYGEWGGKWRQRAWTVTDSVGFYALSSYASCDPAGESRANLFINFRWQLYCTEEMQVVDFTIPYY